VKYFSLKVVNSTKNLALILFSASLLAGCGTVVTYKQNIPAGPATPLGYPIPVYTEDQSIPRPSEVIGTVFVGTTALTVVGGSVDDVMIKVMQTAREKGADTVQVTSIDKPDYTNPKYRVAADLLRYTDRWETIAISENEFLAYLQRNKKSLDPIEGVWFADSQYENRIGIMRNASKRGRDFIGFVLNGEPPSWRRGYKKIDIARGKQRGIYNFNFYLDDFSQIGTTVVLANPTEFILLVGTSDGSKMVTYSKY